MLLQKSATFNIDLNAKDSDGNTAFELACKNGHLEVTRMLLEKSSELKIEIITPPPPRDP